MSSSRKVPYLRLVEGPASQVAEAVSPDDDGTLLGIINMSSVSGEGFVSILSRLRPPWVFDLRVVPYFDIGQFSRKRAFDLFSSLGASYRDVTGRLKITDRNDASLNSGAIACYLAEAMSTRPSRAPIVVLVDDGETLGHALRVLPGQLNSSCAAWRAFELGTIERDGQPDLTLRTASGEASVWQAT